MRKHNALLWYTEDFMEKVMNRWIVVIGALIVQICLGAIYAWSVFVQPLEDLGFTRTQTQAVFSMAIATFAFVMIFAGRWQDKIGPRVVALTGGIVLGIGYILAGLIGKSVQQTSLFLTIFSCVGIIGGAGIGLAYVCPLAAGVKWFPDKRGLITGLAVAGFGGGAWFFARIASSLILSSGVLHAFLILGIIFFIATIIGSFVLVNPPEGWTPKGWNPDTNTKAKVVSNDYTWQQMLGTKHFWLMWLMFTFSATSGLMVIGHIKPFAIASGADAAMAGAAVGILAIFNAAGRILWGWISDKIGRRYAMLTMFILQGFMMLILIKMGGSSASLAIAAAWVGFNFGGNFALFPSATADFFGTKNLGVNYGLVFTSYGLAGIIGPIIGGTVFDITGSYVHAFTLAGVLCLIAVVLSFGIKKVK